MLRDRVAIITGAASGIGEECARCFVAAGARVVIADMNEEKGREVAASLGDAALFVRVAVHEEADVQAAVARTVEHFGRLDCLLNNAGFGGVIGPIEDIPASEWDLSHAVLVRGVFLGIKHAVPAMKRQGGGSIINVASVAGVRAGYSPHAYAAAKAAVIHLTASVALELAPHEIRVNCISPGFIATPLTTNTSSGARVSMDDARKGLAAMHPLERAGEPEDIAQAALFFASDASSFVTGQNLLVDGGLSAGRKWSEQPAYFHRYSPIKVHRPKGA